MSGDIRPVTDEDLYTDLSDDGSLTKAQARRVTEEIKLQVVGLWQLVKMAYIGRAWVVLGYESWDAYCETEFPTSRLRLPREDRSEVVASLRESGLSLRAIESATGISRPTIIKDLGTSQVVNSLPPAESEPVDVEVDDDAPGPKVDDPPERDANGEPERSYRGVPQPADRTTIRWGDGTAWILGKDVKDRVIGLDGKRYPGAQKRPVKARKLTAVEKQRKMIMRIITFVDQVREANSLLRVPELDPGIGPDEAATYAEALNKNFQPIIGIYELLLKRAGGGAA